MPDRPAFVLSLEPYRKRLRIAALAYAALLGTASAGLVLVGAWVIGGSEIHLVTASMAAFVITMLAASHGWSTRWTSATVAARVQSRTMNADNIIVTTEEVASGRTRRPHPIVEAALYDAAVERLAQTPAHVVQPLGQPLALAAGALAALVVLGVALPQRPAYATREALPARPPTALALSGGDLRVVVTPPAYARQQVTVALNPTSIVALEGSRVRLETARTATQVFLVDANEVQTPFRVGAHTMSLDLIAATSQPLIVRLEDATGGTDRLLHLRVRLDNRPTIRISRPAQDLMLPEPKGEVPIEIEAQDDVGLESVALEYTRMSGSGETFAFEEGEWPLQIAANTSADWKAHASLALQTLTLQDGDTLVYRAIARDAKPGADPTRSETFLIEIGRLAGVASTGFALPEERDRQALSQQMLIIKTQRLHAERAKLSKDALIEQSRLLAVEQRMVKAEFVFMTGGEVVDEVEEATSAHELAEGRLENTAQVELLAAIREMSRAESRLNDGDTARALTFERAALGALQRAFDRRRYLLRTLPERTRIDLARRLTGELALARSSRDSTGAAAADPLVMRARELLRELSKVDQGSTNVALLASRIITVDPSSELLQKAAVQLTTASGESARADAVGEAERALLNAIQQRLSPGSEIRLMPDPLAGRLAEELRRLKGGVR